MSIHARDRLLAFPQTQYPVLRLCAVVRFLLVLRLIQLGLPIKNTPNISHRPGIVIDQVVNVFQSPAIEFLRKPDPGNSPCYLRRSFFLIFRALV